MERVILITEQTILWITHGDIPWDDREKAARIHYLCGLLADSEQDDNTIKEAARTLCSEIIAKNQLRRMDHRILAMAFMVRVQYEEPEPAQPPDEFQCMLRDLEICGAFTELTYDSTRSKPQFKVDISPEDGKETPYQPPYCLSPKEDAELQRQLEKALCNGWIRPSRSHYGSPVLFISKKDIGVHMCIDYRAVNHFTRKDRDRLPRIE